METYELVRCTLGGLELLMIVYAVGIVVGAGIPFVLFLRDYFRGLL